MNRSCDRCDMPATTYYGSNYETRAFCRAHADQFHAEERQRFADETVAAGGPWPQTCPRRMGEWGPWERNEGEDRWEYGHGIITPELIPTCSFCGGAQPEFVIEKVREGWMLHGTDKRYKAYFSKPSGEDVAKVYFQHFTMEQREALQAALNDA